MKLQKHGMEKRWNRYGEPFLQFISSLKVTNFWLNRKTTKNERKYKMVHFMNIGN